MINYTYRNMCMYHPLRPTSTQVLKDVRLRCTFASTDSGGISGQRLAVLDKYAHVLKELPGVKIMPGLELIGDVISYVISQLFFFGTPS